MLTFRDKTKVDFKEQKRTQNERGVVRMPECMNRLLHVKTHNTCTALRHVNIFVRAFTEGRGGRHNTATHKP